MKYCFRYNENSSFYRKVSLACYVYYLFLNQFRIISNIQLFQKSGRRNKQNILFSESQSYFHFQKNTSQIRKRPNDTKRKEFFCCVQIKMLQKTSYSKQTYSHLKTRIQEQVLKCTILCSSDIKDKQSVKFKIAIKKYIQSKHLVNIPSCGNN